GPGKGDFRGWDGVLRQDAAAGRRARRGSGSPDSLGGAPRPALLMRDDTDEAIGPRRARRRALALAALAAALALAIASLPFGESGARDGATHADAALAPDLEAAPSHVDLALGRGSERAALVRTSPTSVAE